MFLVFILDRFNDLQCSLGSNQTTNLRLSLSHLLFSFHDLSFFIRRLLPVPHPIVIRKYQPNQHTAIWFTAFMWGVVFIRNQDLPMFDGKKIRLFTVSTA